MKSKWGNFFKPTWGKGALGILFFIILWVFSLSCSQLTECEVDSCNPTSCGELLYDLSTLIHGAWILTIIGSYLLACFVIWGFNKSKKKK